MKILLVSDVHLDAPFAWAKPDVARRRRQALRDALARAIQLAIEERVDVVFCGGDLFEHDRVSPDTGQFLRAQFERVHPVPIYIAPGNHDWLGPESLYRRVRWSPNVHLFEERRLTPVTLDDGLILWGAAHVAPAGAPNFLEGFKVDRSAVNVALFHGSDLGLLAREGECKHPHAPFRAADISDAGLNFAFLGHYHTPQDADHFSYPGNPEPLTFGELGDRGVVIADIHDDGGVTTTRHAVAVSQVHDLRIDVTGAASRQQIRSRIEEALNELGGYARVTLTGEVAPDVDLDSSDAADLVHNLHSSPIVRFESVTVAYDLATLAQEPTVRGQFVRDVQASALDDTERQRVIITGLRALQGRQDLETF
jgi:DNA repair protein SbcD/Mre11